MVPRYHQKVSSTEAAASIVMMTVTSPALRDATYNTEALDTLCTVTSSRDTSPSHRLLILAYFAAAAPEGFGPCHHARKSALRGST
eukprot:3941213-Rhodomonas_salina.2